MRSLNETAVLIGVLDYSRDGVAMVGGATVSISTRLGIGSGLMQSGRSWMLPAIMKGVACDDWLSGARAWCARYSHVSC